VRFGRDRCPDTPAADGRFWSAGAGCVLAGQGAGVEVGVDGVIDAGVALEQVHAVGAHAGEGEQARSGQGLVHGLVELRGGVDVAVGVHDERGNSIVDGDGSGRGERPERARRDAVDPTEQGRLLAALDGVALVERGASRGRRSSTGFNRPYALPLR
jgi:hypothetical protein